MCLWTPNNILAISGKERSNTHQVQSPTLQFIIPSFKFMNSSMPLPIFTQGWAYITCHLDCNQGLEITISYTYCHTPSLEDLWVLVRKLNLLLFSGKDGDCIHCESQ
ncbi:uncharacterized protein LOC143024564 [Oratosquilla oratoria]|uniref:uncharacterized protein LOC143024564 n=1 Tax=Oratosquilla oratoria TaxID=337810 RepID=UPI003F75D7B3